MLRGGSQSLASTRSNRGGKTVGTLLFPPGLNRTWVGWVYTCVCAFLILFPFSVANAYQYARLLKYARTAALVLAALPFLIVAWRRLNSIAVVYLSFIALYIAGALWSSMPLQGLIYKGLLLAVAMAAWSLVHIEITAVGTAASWCTFRVLSLAGVLMALWVGQLIASGTPIVMYHGRLAVGGINPNSLAMAVAPFALAAACALQYDRTRWCLLHATCSIVATVIVLATGSRGGAGIIVTGLTIEAVVARRFRSMVWIVLGGAAVVTAAGYFLQSHATVQRIAEIDLRTREVEWQRSMREFEKSPIWGAGWVASRGTVAVTENMVNAYINISIELGIIGLVAFGVTILFAILPLLSGALTGLTTAGIPSAAVGILGAMLAHGVVESAILLPSTCPAFFLAFGFFLWGECVRLFNAARLIQNRSTQRPAT